MTKCPTCGVEGADVLLMRVFCPNEACQWYDELTQQRNIAKTLDSLDIFARTLDNSSSNPDKTPVWHPGFTVRDP